MGDRLPTESLQRPRVFDHAQIGGAEALFWLKDYGLDRLLPRSHRLVGG